MPRSSAIPEDPSRNNKTVIDNPNRPVSLGSLRQENTRLVLNLLHQYQPISRLKLAKRSNISVATITRITGAMLEHGIIEVKDTVDTARGRKPVLLQLNTSSRVIGAVHLTGSKIMVGLVDLAGDILATETIRGPLPDDIAGTFTQINETINSLLEERDFARDAVLGYGFAFPGFVRPQDYFIDVAINFGWRPGSIGQILEDLFGDNVFIDGLAETMAQTEYFFGPKELRTPRASTLFLFAGEGVGAVLMTDDRVFRGTSGDAGDIGHIPAVKGGAPCRCGNRGCLETLVSKTAILSRYHNLARHGDTPPEGPGQNPSEELAGFLGSKPERPELAALLDDIAAELAWAILVGINCYDPTRIVLGGDVFSAGGDSLLQRVTANVHKKVLHEHRKKIPIQLKSSSDEAGVLGAASLVCNGLWKLTSS